MDRIDFHSVLLGVIAGREDAEETRDLINEALELGAININEFRSLMGMLRAREG